LADRPELSPALIAELGIVKILVAAGWTKHRGSPPIPTSWSKAIVRENSGFVNVAGFEGACARLTTCLRSRRS
jgi:hypothetical protein